MLPATPSPAAAAPLAPLPQQILPVDPRQSLLTDRHLSGEESALFDYFMALRAETDAALAPRLPMVGGKPYPYGRCEEINRAVFERLGQRLQRPSHPVEHTLLAFITEGGVARMVWGVLREQYFQNALQFGGLYIDVSNDTVVVAKPKVEILPVEDSGLVNVRDLAHFRRTAERYWSATVYANHLAPTLAPLLPMLSSSPGKLRPGLQSACDYMIALMQRDRFQEAEAWLESGPTPPADVAAAVLAGIPADLRPLTTDPRAEALAACRRARDAGCDSDVDWRNARVLDCLRVQRRAG